MKTNFFHEQKKKKAFTLVELIIVITILAILATIAFMSFQGYMKQSRDAVRVSDLASASKGLSIFFTKSGVYPETESGILITANGTTITKQGKLGENVVIVINMNQVPLDPMDQTKYTYSTNSSRTKYELLGYTENSNLVSLLPQTFALNFSERGVNLVGDELGIILNGDNTLPSGDVETSTGSKTYKVLFDNATQFESSGNLVFSQIYNMRADLLKNKELASLDDSLVGYWDMETLLAYWSVMTGTGYQLKDLSKYGNHGSCFNGSNEVSCGGNVGGPQIVNGDGKTGKAMIFDGVNDYIRYGIHGLPSGSEARTLYIKVKNGTGYMTPVSSMVFWGSNNNNQTFEFSVSGNDLEFARWGTDFRLRKITTSNYDYLTITCDGDVNCIVNDNGYNTMLNLGYPLNTVLMAYGGIGGGRHAYYTGIIDEVRIYNRALSDSEIKALYSATK